MRLFLDRLAPSPPGVAKTVEFLGIRETSFNGLAPQLVEFLSTDGKLVCPDLFFFSFPDVPGDGALLAFGGKTIGA